MTKTNVQPIPSNSQHHDTPFHSCRKARMMSRVWGWDRVCEAQWSNKSPSGAFKRQRGLRTADGGALPRQALPQQDHIGNADALKK